MKLLYGVCSEGMGHCTRSGAVIEHLLEQGHEVRLTGSGAPLRYLQRLFPSLLVFESTGLEISKTEGRLNDFGTLLGNVWKQTVGAVKSSSSFVHAVAWRPDAVISDFDAFSARVAHAALCPLIAVDNIHAYSKCSHPPAVTSAMAAHALGAGLFVTDAMVPFARRYLVTSCFAGIPKSADTSVFPALLRTKVLDAKYDHDRASVYETSGGHLTVYPGQIPVPHDALSVLPCESHVWLSNLDMQFSNGKVTYYPFSEDAFVGDLASARAVVASAGHSLISEASYLGVPVLAVPLQGQFEQELNAAYVEYLGWGEACSPQDLDWQRLTFFLDRAPQYAETLAALPEHDRNHSLLLALDLELASVT